ncbi:hypothetical protein N7478_006106 [Penicillium angulare]|uniref:uncharacterized protein n=1 Tax=Penicillium angulare TaxID=116970 RepID=UPI0025424816|nr:uncharacterized protein N7478_006106 [Penicillium angulare]KAJ5280734.1 hypothetical protein N7478_006106 [Penicillium angulare]
MASEQPEKPERYTEEFYEKVKAAFPPLSKYAPPSDEVIKEAQGPRYHLRPREKKPQPSKTPAWVDNEQDEDYKPGSSK